MSNLTPLDIKMVSKEEAMRRLWRAEFLYLRSRGWEALCGVPDKYMVKPGEDYRLPETILYSMQEALKIQKEADDLPEDIPSPSR